MRRTGSDLPRVKLMAVATLSGISAEPMLLFPKAAASADYRQWGKTSFHPSQAADTQHTRHIQTAMQQITPRQAVHQEAVMQKQTLQKVARMQAQERTNLREKQPQKESIHER